MRFTSVKHNRAGLPRPPPPANNDLTRLFAKTQSELIRYCRRQLGDLERAREFAQEASLRFTRGGYDASSADARAILFAIARNLLADNGRKLKRQREHGFEVQVELDAIVDLPIGEVGLDRLHVAREDLKAVTLAIQSLPARCRQVFIMHRLQGRKHQEIASTLGISRSMVEKHIVNATLKLMEAIDQP